MYRTDTTLSAWLTWTAVLHSFAFLIMVASTAVVAPANPADLDPNFGNFGRMAVNVDGTGNKWSSSVALQPDGKFVIAGGGGSPSNFFVARFNADGTPDLGFGTNGSTSVVLPGQSAAYDVAIQADGKIVLGGHYALTSGPSNSEVAVARLNADGSPDMTFDMDGKVTVSFSGTLVSNYQRYFSALRIAPDGKIVIAGHALLSATDDRFMFARLNGDGSPDASFGSAGRYVAPANGGGHNNEITDMLILADGSIVTSGYLIVIGGNFRFVQKHSANGTGREWSYAPGFVNQIPGSAHAFMGLTVLPDGKFIAVGKKDEKITVERINSNGTADNTFVLPTMPGGIALSVGVQADGKVVSNYSSGGSSSYSVMRMNSNGSLDTGFGAGGFGSAAVVVPGADSAQRLFVQPDQKILVAGHTSANGQFFYGALRYRGGNFVPERAAFDYDGDNKSDISVFRPSDGVWYLNRSTAGFTAVQFGLASDRIVPADYDGDGKTDIAIYRNGDWWIFQSSNSTVRVVNFGIAEDKTQPGDFDGDGKDDQAVFRPSTGVWYVFRSTDNGFHAVGFGSTEDIPQRGDYDDDGKSDLALFRPSNGHWYIQKSTGGYLVSQFGTSGDVPVASDYDGDSKPDIAVWRPSSGDWYVLNSANGQITTRNFGLSGDVPVPADYNGDGRVDIAIFRAATATWYQLLSPSGTWSQQVFGVNNDRPTPAAYTP